MELDADEDEGRKGAANGQSSKEVQAERGRWRVRMRLVIGTA